MKIIYNNIIPFKAFKCINLGGILFARKGAYIGEKTLNHEAIHTAQMKEMLYIPFYIWYFIEWVIKLCKYGKDSYRNLSFEKEAFANDDDLTYLASRKRFAWWKYL